MIANGEIGRSRNAPKLAEVESKLILEKSFKKSSSEEGHAKEIQPAKENATLTSAKVYKCLTHEHKSMLSLHLVIKRRNV